MHHINTDISNRKHIQHIHNLLQIVYLVLNILHILYIFLYPPDINRLSGALILNVPVVFTLIIIYVVISHVNKIRINLIIYVVISLISMLVLFTYGIGHIITYLGICLSLMVCHYLLRNVPYVLLNYMTNLYRNAVSTYYTGYNKLYSYFIIFVIFYYNLVHLQCGMNMSQLGYIISMILLFWNLKILVILSLYSGYISSLYGLSHGTRNPYNTPPLKYILYKLPSVSVIFVCNIIRIAWDQIILRFNKDMTNYNGDNEDMTNYNGNNNRTNYNNGNNNRTNYNESILSPNNNRGILSPNNNRNILQYNPRYTIYNPDNPDITRYNPIKPVITRPTTIKPDIALSNLDISIISLLLYDIPVVNTTNYNSYFIISKCMGFRVVIGLYFYFFALNIFIVTRFIAYREISYLYSYVILIILISVNFYMNMSIKGKLLHMEIFNEYKNHHLYELIKLNYNILLSEDNFVVEYARFDSRLWVTLDALGTSYE
ncbi:uncharacterized protein NESG_00741 [Nematocida ausubeli]|uniref:Uncharacterized protein n=1 Tax=Nematocida ausubeli (strain ATCC PRA-371 / ERTm2) TaxID=1913371 RepID=A0A086J372_NEMA1|nr:uncharacterized protein NESG_00741 [Nematocida ausubeli]KFG26590.1 hypothetical protein NESG_00741 [Nematocida ausubeli]